MSDMTKILRVGVVGGGQMGAGIAEVCARAGVHRQQQFRQPRTQDSVGI